MKRTEPKDVVASIQARLVNRSHELGVEHQLTLARFGVERLLFRLSQSEHANRFVVKGAALLLIWLGASIRPTKDVDLLGFGDTSAEALEQIFISICGVRAPDDGLTFLPDSVHVEPIREGQEYGGMRVTLTALLGKVRIPLQVDVGAGDAVVPPAESVDFPGLLELPRARVRAYRPETSIAEKTEAMVRLGRRPQACARSVWCNSLAGRHRARIARRLPVDPISCVAAWPSHGGGPLASSPPTRRRRRRISSNNPVDPGAVRCGPGENPRDAADRCSSATRGSKDAGDPPRGPVVAGAGCATRPLDRARGRGCAREDVQVLPPATVRASAEGQVAVQMERATWSSQMALMWLRGAATDAGVSCVSGRRESGYASSHAARVMPACRRMIARSPTPMSPECGLGIVRTRSPRAMNWWQPPEYGPVKPSRRSDAVSFRRLTGPQGGISWLA